MEIKRGVMGDKERHRERGGVGVGGRDGEGVLK